MYKNIFASLTGLASDTAVLNTSVQVATAFSAHVDCVHVSLGKLESDAAIASQSTFLHARAIEELRAFEGRIAAQAGAARAAFDAICKEKDLTVTDNADAACGKPSYAYREIVGVDLDETIRQARFHDLTIIARDSRNVVLEPDRAGTVLLASGRPTLVPPRKATKTLGSRIVVAWKDGAPAARAVASAMPFFAKAESVVVLVASEGETDLEKVTGLADALVRDLRWHDIFARVQALKFSLKPAGETILDEAYRLDADLLVMGGYGHSRMREVVFGGMTREILAECEIPVLMSH